MTPPTTRTTGTTSTPRRPAAGRCAASRTLVGVLAATALVAPGPLSLTGPAAAAVTTITSVSDDGIPDSWDWRRSHDEGGACNDRTSPSSGGTALLTRNWAAACEDGLDPREAKAGANNGRFEVRDVLMTNIKDDSVENDHFMPGLIKDSLFDGVWTFLSEQRSGTTTNTIGPSESRYIDVQNSHVRLFTTNADEPGPGRWFKFKGDGAPHHTLRISGSTFAASQEPRSGWSSLSIPAGTQWLGTNNHILWLGTGTYGGPRPAGVTFLSGSAAVAKWQDVRNRFYVDHSLVTRAAGDLDPRRWTPRTSG